MSDRKAANLGDPLARLASIEAPEFLDQLVLEQARALLLERRPMAGLPSSPEVETSRRASEPATAPIAALLERLTLRGLKSS